MVTPTQRSISQGTQLAQWVYQSIGLPQGRVKIRFRGNTLHILCEASQCPPRQLVLRGLLHSLNQTHLNPLLPADQPDLHRIVIYGRVTGKANPDWTEAIELHQLDRYLEQLSLVSAAVAVPPEAATTVGTDSSQPTVASSPVTTTDTDQPSLLNNAALVVSNWSLAKQGHPDAIARYLSETLSQFNVGVRVAAKTVDVANQLATVSDPTMNTDYTRRLWISCLSPYSPDPMVVAEPIAQQLRKLELQGYRDAVLYSQVAGENQPDWVLRVDLTPPDEMLHNLARWGDRAAITQLANQALAADGMAVTVKQKQSTLYCFCYPRVAGEQSQRSEVDASDDALELAPDPDVDRSATATSQANPPTVADRPLPDQQRAIAALAPLLERLSPQGIHAAFIYGIPSGTDLTASQADQADDQPEGEMDAPLWMHWLHLPSAQHPELAVSPRELAEAGDLQAIAYLLNRLLNPDLQWQLATGGVRLQLLRKLDLLHVMVDAPLCPPRHRVAVPTAQFLRQLRLPKISGVRIYGRRAGQQRPLWSYGLDFITRNRLVPEATPEFAASHAYVGDLLTEVGGALVKPDTAEGAIAATEGDTLADPLHLELVTADDQLDERIDWEHWFQQIQQALIRTQLFVPVAPVHGSKAVAAPPDYPPDASPRLHQTSKIAVVWGLASLLLTFQIDWVTGQLVQQDTRLATRNRAAELLSQTDTAQAAALPHATPRPEERTTNLTELPGVSLRRSQSTDDGVFSPDSFTQAGNTSLTVRVDPNRPNQPVVAPDLLYSPPATPPMLNPADRALLANMPVDYPTFNNPLLDEKLTLYRQHLKLYGPPDVLIVGSSRALRGVDPTALKTMLAEQGYADVSVFNFGINGATAKIVDMVVQEILQTNQLPHVIIWADGARALNGGRVDSTYNAMRASEGYTRLTEGTLPGLVRPGNISSMARVVRPANQISLEQSYQVVDGLLNQAIAKLSSAYGGRDRAKGLIRDLFAKLPSNTPFPIAAMTGQGRSKLLPGDDPAQLTLPEGEGNIDFNGFLSLSVRFNPATYYQNYARVPGDYDADYDSFRLTGQQAEALERLALFARQQQIALVFVNLPLSSEYLDPVRREYEDQFQQFMRRSASQFGFTFRDLSQEWLLQHDYFSDPSHLNRYGAYAVSEKLARDSLIPWGHRRPTTAVTP